MTDIPVKLEAHKPESAAVRRAFHRAGITSRSNGDLAADLQCWLAEFKTGIFDHLAVSLDSVTQFSPVLNEGNWPEDCDAAFIIGGSTYQRTFKPEFMEWGRQFPVSARRLLAILGHASHRTIPIVLPDDLLDIAMNYYWQGEADERLNLEELKEAGEDTSDLFTRAKFDASFPDWMTTHSAANGADPRPDSTLHDHHEAVVPIKSIVDQLQELVLDEGTAHFNHRNDFDPSCRASGAFLLRTGPEDCAEQLYDEAMQIDSGAGACVDAFTAIPVNSHSELGIIESLEKLWTALHAAELMHLVLEQISLE